MATTQSVHDLLRMCVEALENPLWQNLEYYSHVGFTKHIARDVLMVHGKIAKHLTPELIASLREAPLEPYSKWEREKFKRLRLELDLLEFYRKRAVLTLTSTAEQAMQIYGVELRGEQEFKEFIAAKDLALQKFDDTSAMHTAINLLECRAEVPELLNELAELEEAARTGDLNETTLTLLRFKASLLMRRLSPGDGEARIVQATLQSLGLESIECGLP